MFKKKSHWIEHLFLIKINGNMDIAVSMKFDKKSKLIVTAIHLDQGYIARNHMFAEGPQHECNCLNGFRSGSSNKYLEIGNPDDMKNKLNAANKKIEKLKQEIETLQNNNDTK